MADEFVFADGMDSPPPNAKPFHRDPDLNLVQLQQVQQPQSNLSLVPSEEDPCEVDTPEMLSDEASPVKNEALAELEAQDVLSPATQSAEMVDKPSKNLLRTDPHRIKGKLRNKRTAGATAATPGFHSRKYEFMHSHQPSQVLIPDISSLGSPKPAPEKQQCIRNVDLLVVGGGPASLGMCIHAMKNNSFKELIQDDGMVILEAGSGFGGGNLGSYGINSNTSANSFLKCILRKQFTEKVTGIPTQPAVQANTAGKDKKKEESSNKKIRRHQKVFDQKITAPTEPEAPNPPALDSHDMQLYSMLTQLTINNEEKHITEPNSRNSARSSQHKLSELKLVGSVNSPQILNSPTQVITNQQLSSGHGTRRKTPSRPPTSRVGSAATRYTAGGFNGSRYSNFAGKSNNVTIEDVKEQECPFRNENNVVLIPTKNNDLCKSSIFKSPKIQQMNQTIPFHAMGLEKAAIRPITKSTAPPIASIFKQSGKMIAFFQNNSSKKPTNTSRFTEKHKQRIADNVKNIKVLYQSSANILSDQKRPNTSAAVSSLPQDFLTPFRELGTASVCNSMRRLGKTIAPLSLAGHMLNCVGNHVLHYAWQMVGKRIFYPQHKVESIQLLPGGSCIVKAVKTDFHLNKDLEKIDETKSVVFFRAKAVILAAGAQQQLPQTAFLSFPQLDPKKTISSDFFLKKEGFTSGCENLRQLQEERDKPLRVVIVGGSHSGFSCAWMLCNGPASHVNNESGAELKKAFLAPRKSIKGCPECCRCSVRNTSKAAAASLGGTFGTASRATGHHHVNPTAMAKQVGNPDCPCLCKCFGHAGYNDWSLFQMDQIPNFRPGLDRIDILYRSRIKVYYKNLEEAQKAGYEDYDQEQFKSNPNGYVYAFTGLRGDAKTLYSKVKAGEEARVNLIKATTPEAQRPYIEKADLVIWACGYQTNPIPILDANKRKMELSQRIPNSQFDVDKKCRLMLEDGSVLSRVFACGVGYPIRIKEGFAAPADPNTVKKKPKKPKDINKFNVLAPRADSFSIYMKSVGEILIKNVLPKRTLLDMPHSHILNKETAPNAAASQLDAAATFDKARKTMAVCQTPELPFKMRGAMGKSMTSHPKNAIELAPKKAETERKLTEADPTQDVQQMVQTIFLPNKLTSKKEEDYVEEMMDDLEEEDEYSDELEREIIDETPMPVGNKTVLPALRSSDQLMQQLSKVPSQSNFKDKIPRKKSILNYQSKLAQMKGGGIEGSHIESTLKMYMKPQQYSLQRENARLEKIDKMRKKSEMPKADMHTCAGVQCATCVINNQPSRLSGSTSQLKKKKRKRKNGGQEQFIEDVLSPKKRPSEMKDYILQHRELTEEARSYMDAEHEIGEDLKMVKVPAAVKTPQMLKNVDGQNIQFQPTTAYNSGDCQDHPQASSTKKEYVSHRKNTMLGLHAANSISSCALQSSGTLNPIYSNPLTKAKRKTSVVVPERFAVNRPEPPSGLDRMGAPYNSMSNRYLSTNDPMNEYNLRQNSTKQIKYPESQTPALSCKMKHLPHKKQKPTQAFTELPSIFVAKPGIERINVKGRKKYEQRSEQVMSTPVRDTEKIELSPKRDQLLEQALAKAQLGKKSNRNRNNDRVITVLTEESAVKKCSEDQEVYQITVDSGENYDSDQFEINSNSPEKQGQELSDCSSCPESNQTIIKLSETPPVEQTTKKAEVQQSQRKKTAAKKQKSNLQEFLRKSSESLIYKPLGKSAKEMTEQTIVMTKHTTTMNLAQHSRRDKKHFGESEKSQPHSKNQARIQATYNATVAALNSTQTSNLVAPSTPEKKKANHANLKGGSAASTRYANQSMNNFSQQKLQPGSKQSQLLESSSKVLDPPVQPRGSKVQGYKQRAINSLKQYHGDYCDSKEDDFEILKQNILSGGGGPSKKKTFLQNHFSPILKERKSAERPLHSGKAQEKRSDRVKAPPTEFNVYKSPTVQMGKPISVFKRMQNIEQEQIVD